MTGARNAQLKALFGAKFQKNKLHECSYIISCMKMIMEILDNFME